MFFLPFHLFTNFNLFSKVQRPILSWPIMSLKVFPVIPCAPSSPPPIRSHQITCWSPKLSLLFLNSVLLKSSFPLFSKCFLPLSSSSASIRPDSAYSGMLFLIPKHRIRGSNHSLCTPYLDAGHIGVWVSGPVSSHLCILGAWHCAWDRVGTHRRVWNLVRSLILPYD